MFIRPAIHIAATLAALAAVFFAGWALDLAAPAQAQSVCGDRTEIIKVLAAKYKELPRAFGIAGQRHLAELFVSQSGSWTMLMTQPRGVTCILATGVDWQEMPPVTMGKPTSVTVRNDSGGILIRYATTIAKLRDSGESVRVIGRCDSACTLYLGLPPQQLCIGPGASFRFHAPSASSPHAVKVARSYMMKKYPGWVRSWIRSRGGLSPTLITMDYGYARSFIKPCGS